MDLYFEEQYFLEDIVVEPQYLNSNLKEHLRLYLNKKYPKIYLNKGYIFNIEICKFLDNRINLSSQIVIPVEFRADIYIPKVNHIFQGTFKKGSTNKYQWVEVGPLIIFLKKVEVNLEDGVSVTVQITDMKPDKSICVGKILC
jgi:DNA-directed RNA polymerase subunit E'/Rpb7